MNKFSNYALYVGIVTTVLSLAAMFIDRFTTLHLNEIELANIVAMYYTGVTLMFIAGIIVLIRKWNELE